jgi:hypothetical protein
MAVGSTQHQACNVGQLSYYQAAVASNWSPTQSSAMVPCFSCCRCVHVQVEDVALCEAVQQGLQEPAYGVGRYAPGPEAPMYHFHSLLYGAVMQHLCASSR